MKRSAPPWCNGPRAQKPGWPHGLNSPGRQPISTDNDIGLEAAQAVPSEPGNTAQAPNPTPRRREMVLFVAKFLVVTLAALVGYRYAADTTFMDWYLFQIAGQTSALLGLVGHSSQVEDPAAFRGRESEVRAFLHTWTASAPPEDGAPTSLTSWETWRYRVSGRRRDLAALDGALHALSVQPAVQATDRQRIASRVEALDNAMSILEGVSGAARLRQSALPNSPRRAVP